MTTKKKAAKTSRVENTEIGDPLTPIQDDYVEPAPTKKELDDLEKKWKLYAPEEYKELYNPEVFSFDKSKMEYTHVATGRVLTRRELHKILREFTRNFTKNYKGNI